MRTITDVTASTITVVVPIAIRQRNGRPKIVLPDDGSPQPDAGDPAKGAVLRAIARAWDWRRRLETGEVSTLQDLADAEKVTVPYISRLIRLAYLSPRALARIIGDRESVAVSLDGLAAAALEPWAKQQERIFGGVAAAPPHSTSPGSVLKEEV